MDHGLQPPPQAQAPPSLSWTRPSRLRATTCYASYTGGRPDFPPARRYSPWQDRSWPNPQGHRAGGRAMGRPPSQHGWLPDLSVSIRKGTSPLKSRHLQPISRCPSSPRRFPRDVAAVAATRMPPSGLRLKQMARREHWRSLKRHRRADDVSPTRWRCPCLDMETSRQRFRCRLQFESRWLGLCHVPWYSLETGPAAAEGVCAPPNPADVAVEPAMAIQSSDELSTRWLVRRDDVGADEIGFKFEPLLTTPCRTYDR
jgi:hypothetical protein